MAVAVAAHDDDQDATTALDRQAPARGLDVAELVAVAEARWPKPALHRRAFRAGRRWTTARMRRLHRPAVAPVPWLSRTDSRDPPLSVWAVQAQLSISRARSQSPTASPR